MVLKSHAIVHSSIFLVFSVSDFAIIFILLCRKRGKKPFYFQSKKMKFYYNPKFKPKWRPI